MPTHTTTSCARPRKVRFQHIKTGRIISARSITEFSRKARLGPYGPYHFDEILKGKRLHHKGWGLPKRLNQKLALKDVFGNQMTTTVGALARNTTTCRANRLASGQPFGAVARSDHDFGPILPPRSFHVKSYALRLPGFGTAKSAAARAIRFNGVNCSTTWIGRHGTPRQKRLLAEWRMLRSRSVRVPGAGSVVTGQTLREVGERAGIGLQGAFSLVHGYRHSIKGITLHGVERIGRCALPAL